MDTLIDILLTTLTFFIVVTVILLIIFFIPLCIVALGITLSLNIFLIFALEILYGCFVAAIIV